MFGYNSQLEKRDDVYFRVTFHIHWLFEWNIHIRSHIFLVFLTLSARSQRKPHKKFWRSRR